MDPNAMTTLLGDANCSIEEEEYQKACQHALKSPYEARTRDEDEEEGEAPSDDDEDSNSESDNSSSDSSSSDSGDGEDDSSNDSESNYSENYDSQFSGNDWGESPNDIEYKDDGLYYEDYDDNVDYYDEDIKDDAEAEPIDMGSDTNSDQYRLENVLEVAGEEIGEADNVDYGRLSDQSYITNVSLKSSPRNDKHGREIPEFGSFHNSKLGSLTPYIEEKDEIDARLVALDQKLMVHSFKTQASRAPNMIIRRWKGMSQNTSLNAPT